MTINKYILVLFLWGFSPLLHPLHLSVSNVDFNEDGDQVKISVKIFIDDLEDVIAKNTGVKISIENNCSLCDSLIDLYVRNNFVLYHDNDSIINLIFLDVEKDIEAVFIKYETESVNLNGKLIIRNSILTDLYDDQKNLVFIVNKDKKVGFTLDSKSTLVEYDY